MHPGGHRQPGQHSDGFGGFNSVFGSGFGLGFEGFGGFSNFGGDPFGSPR